MKHKSKAWSNYNQTENEDNIIKKIKWSKYNQTDKMKEI